jgi:hypothetical protein
MRIALLVPLLALLAGCQMTVVERLPEGATTDCDADWPGAWIGIEDDGADADTGVLIDAACRVTLIPGDPGPDDAEVTLAPRFLPEHAVVLFAEADVAAAVGDDMPPTAQKDAWLPFRWSRSGDLLELEAPDHRRIATLIVNGAFDGVAHWDGASSGYNVMRGGPAEIRARLAQSSLFGDDDPIRLRRVGDDRKDVDRALKKALRARERR